MLVEAGFYFAGTILRRIVPDCEVRQATSAMTALEMGHLWHPHLFIVDLELPDMRGAELAEVIRGDEALHHIPVLFVSSFVELPEIASGRSALDGSLAFGMPVCMTSFRQHVAKHLHKSDFQRLVQDVARQVLS